MFENFFKIQDDILYINIKHKLSESLYQKNKKQFLCFCLWGEALNVEPKGMSSREMVQIPA